MTVMERVIEAGDGFAGDRRATGGLGAMSAPPNPMRQRVSEANRIYFDAIVDRYEADPRQRYGLFGENARRRYREFVDAHLADIRRGVVVNVACGTGNMMDIDAERGLRSVGFDIAPKMVELAQRYSTRLFVGDFYGMPFRSGSVSFAAGLGLLHHVYDHVAFFRELHRVLMPGGWFYADYDPNYHAVARLDRHPLLGPVWRAYERWSDRVRDLDNRVTPEIFALADYYAVSEPGLKGELVERTIRQAGFDQFRVIPHSDGPSLDRPRRGRIPHKVLETLLLASGEREYTRRAKNLALIARKGTT